MSKTSQRKKQKRAMTPVHNPFNSLDDLAATFKDKQLETQRNLESIPTTAQQLFDQMTHFYNQENLSNSSKTIYFLMVEEDDHFHLYINKFRCWSDGGTLDAHNYNEQVEHRIENVVSKTLDKLTDSKLNYDYEYPSGMTVGINIKVYKEKS